MSVDRCCRCDRLVDTDFDLECYDKHDRCICESCREAEDDFPRELDEKLDDPRHGQADHINKGKY